jgi:hypothetical protein
MKKPLATSSKWCLIIILTTLTSLTTLTGCGNFQKGMIRGAESMGNQGTVGWPKNQKMPSSLEAHASATLSSSASSAARDVVLLFPAIDERHVLHWDALESFRLVLPRTPAALERRVPSGKAIGDLRTSDRALPNDVYKTLQCAFGRTWNGTKRKPKQFLEASFCEAKEKEAEEAAVARNATVGLVDDVLDDLRAKAVNAGVLVVSDVRCYAATDPRRLWCEGTAEVLPSASD